MAAVGGQPASRRGGLHRDDNASPYLSASGPGGPGSGLALSRLGILGELQPRPRRHERQLCRRGANGSVFYRDVPPGHYHIAPQSYGRDINQDKDVDLAPGQQLYCKIVSSRSWELGVGAGGSQSGFDRDTFCVWLMLGRALCRSTASTAQPDAARSHGAPLGHTRRQEALRPAQAHSGASVRHHQIGSGLSTIPAARAQIATASAARFG
jgi:hypothetical protein